MSDTDEAIFREVDEEVRTDEYKRIWDRFGKYLTGLGVAVIAAVAGFQGWKYYEVKQAETASLIYLDAVKKAEAGKSEDALGAFAAVHHDGFSQLAKLRVAQISADKGETEKAVAAYDAFAADAANDSALADLARIRAGYLLVDSAKPDELLVRLVRFEKAGDAWRNEAREILGLAAWRIKDFAGAKKQMDLIFADNKASGSMRQRAQILIQLITPNLPQK